MTEKYATKGFSANGHSFEQDETIPDNAYDIGVLNMLTAMGRIGEREIKPAPSGAKPVKLPE